MKSQKVVFENKEGSELSGRLELPLDQKPTHFAIFAHCFTCGKDLKVVKHMSLALSQQGFAVLRFDFTGLGQSEGNFEDTTFSSNVEDLISAAEFLKSNYQAPSLMVGHSLGGAAVIMAARHLPCIKAIATIAAPCDTDHVLGLIREDLEEIREKGSASVELAGRDFKITQQFVEDLQDRGLQKILESDELRDKALLVMHSPQDTIVEVSNAREIYESAHHPKSFVSLNGADHLLSDPEDSAYAGQLIGAWVKRYLKPDKRADLKTQHDVVTRLEEGPFLTEILAGPHHMLADEPTEVGGDELGPTPYEFVAAGLGSCTAMTIKMYASRKKWPLDEVLVHLDFDSDYTDDCAHCEDDDKRIGRFTREIEIRGDLDEKQVEKLLDIANKCPVHKTLSKGVYVETKVKKSDG